jgi:hypothetical protein
MTAANPKVLFDCYTYSQQTLRVVEAMAGVLRERGCDVALYRSVLTFRSECENFS